MYAGIAATLLIQGLGVRAVAPLLAALLLGRMGTAGDAAPFMAALLMGVLALRGGGPWSLDALIVHHLEKHFPNSTECPRSRSMDCRAR